MNSQVFRIAFTNQQNPMKPNNPQTIWNERYTRYRRGQATYRNDPWLAPYRVHLETGQPAPILELGCGRGFDAWYLTNLGWPVIATDFSVEALHIARQAAPAATFLQLNLRDGLPFPPETFQVIIASLSLHYFYWAQTQIIISHIHHCLRVGGLLLVRLNSTKDTNHGATGHPAVEPNCFLVNGELKRFFDRPDLDRLFQRGWKLLEIEEKTIRRGKAKVIWEMSLEKRRNL